jgi:hypothetical protein
MEKYFSWENFKYIYLEDSYVLEIRESRNSIVFKMEFVLTKNHPLYKEPKRNSQYCYQIGNIKFIEIEEKTWIVKNLNVVNLDANGETDLGNIDNFYKDQDTYYVEGDWGSLFLKCKQIIIDYNNSLLST